MEPAYLLGTGGAIGAVLRHAVYALLPFDRFPAATIVVNVIGSFALGLVAFGGANSELTLFVGVGACGAFTTYSTFSFETVGLWEDGARGLAVANAAANLAGCLFAVALASLLV